MKRRYRVYEEDLPEKKKYGCFAGCVFLGLFVFFLVLCSGLIVTR